MAAPQQVQQMTLFSDKAPARKAKRPKAAQTGTQVLPPVAPPNLRQESALWLLGQQSIEVQRGRRYVRRSVQHPGKMQPHEAGAIIDTYTAEGDVILDPMGGIGTTAVEAAERGRHVVMVELERRWAKVAWCNALRTAYRGATGTIRVIRGDSRRLPELVAGAFDHLVTSPPYGEAIDGRSHNTKRRIERLQAVIEAGELDPTIHNSFARRIRNQGEAVLSQGGWLASVAPQYDADSEGHQADAVVSSPPFGPTQTGRGMALDGINGDGRPPVDRGIGAAYDALVTSPVYGDTKVRSMPSGFDQSTPGGHFSDPPKGYDHLITSPAYGDIRQDGGTHQFGESGAMTNYSGEERVKKNSRDRTNVGNLKYGSMEKALALIARLKAGEQIPETEWPGMEYLETMALIYWHCWYLVKLGGLAILVLKDYRRKKRRVDLVGDTTQLMRAVGWLYHDQVLAVTSKVEDGKVITKVSPFVRINTRKPEKNGGVLMFPAGEVVLIFRKEG